MIKKKVSVVCSDQFGAERIIRFFYFSKFVWDYNEIKICNEIDMNFSKTILIDRKSIENLKITEDHREFKFIICLWNGFFDYQNVEVRAFLYKLKNLKINYKCFLPVLLDEHRKLDDIIYPEKIILNNDIKFISNKKYQFMFNYPNLFYFLRFYKNPKVFFKNLLESKIVFVGGGILNEKSVSKFLDSNIEDNAKKIIYEFYNFSKSNGIKNIFIYLKNLIESELFLSLSTTRRFYLLHRMFRHILFSSMVKFKNFQFYLREYKIGLVRSSLYKNNYYLDLGSSAGFGIYDRSLQLFKHYKNKNINIEFFSKDLDFEKSLRKLESIINKLENISNKNISAYNLIKLLKI